MATEVAPDVVQHRLAHSKVVYLADENLLVDTGPESEWDELQSFLVDCGPIDTLFISHAHADHIGNAGRVRDAYDPEILVPEREPLGDVSLEESEVSRISDGAKPGADVRVLQVPGHTEGICALYLPERETLLGTDVLDGSDRRGLPPGYLLPPPAIYNWDSKQVETNLERLLDLSFETAVVTHGTNVDANARLKLEKYLNFPDHYRADLLAE